MATVYKTFLNNDIKSTRTLLHEAIPLTGTIVSGTYGADTVALGSETNIKNYAHGMFQSVYDYPYLSSSANHIFDLTFGYSSGSALSASTNKQNAKKCNIYNQMAGTLMGYDATGSVIKFDEDGDIAAGGNKISSSVFINFSRLLQKDEVKKGSYSLKLGASGSYTTGSAATEFNELVTITDTGAATAYKVNSAVGEYGILYATGSVVSDGTKVGLIFYQAGVVVLTGSIFMTGGVDNGVATSQTMSMSGSSNDFNSLLTGASIQNMCDAVRHRIYDMSFNNTTELNSTIHFCRVNSSDYNYSANPTYVTASQIRVKNTQTDAPISYITTVGLYSADNELLAVAKVSEPLKKDPTNEMTLRVRLDY
jgi:hypothetical protein